MLTCFVISLSGNKEEYLREMNIKAILDFFIKTEVGAFWNYFQGNVAVSNYFFVMLL